MNLLTHIAENICNLRKIDRVIGFYLYDKFNEPIARVNAILADSGTHQCYYLIINLGGFLQVRGKAVVLPVEICEVEDLGKIKTDWRKESMLESPIPTDIMKITPVEEELIRDYYGLPSQRPNPFGNREK
jgi:hypothetical protein